MNKAEVKELISLLEDCSRRVGLVATMKKVALESSLGKLYSLGEKGRQQFLDRYSEIEKGDYAAFKLNNSELHQSFSAFCWEDELYRLLNDIKLIQSTTRRIFRKNSRELIMPNKTMSDADFAWFLFEISNEINLLHLQLTHEHARMRTTDVLRTKIKLFEEANSPNCFMTSEDGKSWQIEDEVGSRITDITEDEKVVLLALIEISKENRNDCDAKERESHILRATQKDLKCKISFLNNSQNSSRGADLLLQRVLKKHKRKVYGWIVSEDDWSASGRTSAVKIMDKTLFAISKMSEVEKKQTKSKASRTTPTRHVSPS